MFRIYNTYPGIIEKGSTSISGEVYEISNIYLLDRLEGYNYEEVDKSLYIRELVDTEYGEAWMYLYNQSTNHFDEQVGGAW